MTDWAARADAVCYAGEHVEATVDADGAGVVVTSHRVLAFTPETEPRFRAVDRPNVLGVERRRRGGERWLRAAGQWSAVGVGLLLAGWFVDLDTTASVDPSTGGGVVAGGLLSSLSTVLGLLSLLDDALLVGGAVVLAVALALAGLGVRSRTFALTVDVAGESALVVPAGPDAVDRLQSALSGARDSTASGR